MNNFISNATAALVVAACGLATMTMLAPSWPEPWGPSVVRSN